jgi:arsenate reductase
VLCIPFIDGSRWWLKTSIIFFFSAGVEKHGMNEHAIRVMAEAGVDISGHTSKLVEELPDIHFDYVITVCDNAHESCPLFPGKAKIIHKGFDDPPRLAAHAVTDEEALDCYRRVRDEIREFIQTIPGSLINS